MSLERPPVFHEKTIYIRSALENHRVRDESGSFALPRLLFGGLLSESEQLKSNPLGEEAA